ncbi:type IV toxin-antitoxin system AbiEi family antitoxin [Microbacterium sp. GCS4]|uniref:type IV toxin-antitoxin system AbiEi family antitoxin n=1 Tax=Microbacterium sp. GCS4 TaxID=1692239 RepID=UPI000A9AB857|nr:type IV toxin-antitoxin system AbiEi family antitoxin [Microbacterium sp. GCS4]
MASRENPAVAALLRVLPSDFLVEPRVDAVDVALDSRRWTLQPIWAGEGLPADIRRVRNDVMHGRTGIDGLPVIAARRMSPGARELLDESQLSWVDASGRAKIVIPGEVYLARFDPVPGDAGRPFTWSGAAQAVAETLLTWRVRQRDDVPDSIGRVGVIAGAADVSVAHAARVLRHFDEQGYTAKTGAERGSTATRELRDPGRMLSDWAGQYALKGMAPAVEFHVPWRDHDQTLSMFTSSLSAVDWALTGAAAADRIAPYLTSIPTVDVVVPFGALAEVRRRLSSDEDVREVDRGGRVRVFTVDEYLLGLAQDQRGLRIASPVRVYGDLLRERGRSVDAAEYLREVAIGF